MERWRSLGENWINISIKIFITFVYFYFLFCRLFSHTRNLSLLSNEAPPLPLITPTSVASHLTSRLNRPPPVCLSFHHPSLNFSVGFCYSGPLLGSDYKLWIINFIMSLTPSQMMQRTIPNITTKFLASVRKSLHLKRLRKFFRERSIVVVTSLLFPLHHHQRVRYWCSFYFYALERNPLLCKIVVEMLILSH
ncbi:uncharacterized protein LOC120014138 [Tripterygium wilfordii]|uniref:uncharacterized protein LOC120014138 n=1 Tax=Tripterygium wilfordii TaxID=458696 RepID=UPI0018F7F418|nr:uncharacterized protein LOC120014138 [Tripterygium wilfordii]